jgi:hypothetical protein
MFSPFKNYKGSVLNNGCKVLMLQLINKKFHSGWILSIVQKKPLRKEVNSGAGVKVSKRLLVFTGKFFRK